MPSNGTITIGVLRDLRFHFQDRTFSSYALVIKICASNGYPGKFALIRTVPAVEVVFVIIDSSETLSKLKVKTPDTI